MASGDDDLDRDAILARRKRFMARALPRSGDRALAGPRAKALALAVSGLTTACPCLNIYVPPEETEGGETEGSETEGSETAGTEGGETAGITGGETGTTGG